MSKDDPFAFLKQANVPSGEPDFSHWEEDHDATAQKTPGDAPQADGAEEGAAGSASDDSAAKNDEEFIDEPADAEAAPSAGAAGDDAEDDEFLNFIDDSLLGDESLPAAGDDRTEPAGEIPLDDAVETLESLEPLDLEADDIDAAVAQGSEPDADPPHLDFESLLPEARQLTGPSLGGSLDNRSSAAQDAFAAGFSISPGAAHDEVERFLEEAGVREKKSPEEAAADEAAIEEDAIAAMESLDHFSADAATAEASTADEPTTEEPAADDDEFRLEDVAAPAAGAISIDTGPEEAAEEETADGKPKKKKHPLDRRPKRKSGGNPAFEILKVVIGGLVALPVVQLILWWTPIFPDPSRDMFGLAKRLPSYVAFLAPASLRSPTVAENPPPADPNDSSQAPPTFDGKTSDSGLPEITMQGPSDDGSKGNGSQTDPPGGVELPDEPDGAFVGPLDAPTFSGPDMMEALKEAQLTLSNMRAMNPSPDKTVRQQAAAQFYIAWAALGEITAFVDRNALENRGRFDTMHTSLANLESEPDMLSILAVAAQGWLRNPPNRKNNGVLLVGTVTSISREGKLFIIRMELEGKEKRPYTVVSRTHPSQDVSSSYKVNDRVLVLGAIVSNPAANLAGYLGDELEVAWHGYGVRIAGR